MKGRIFVALVGVLVSVAVRPVPAQSDQPILTGPATEERFPPLVVPDGFKATLFACDPLIEYPSVIALGPRRGTLFLAHDYVTGLGIEIVRRDEVRLIDDTDGDGYADRSTVYADGFNSIQGLSFYDGNVFVMHAPLLTRLRDTDGDGTADERTDLIKGLGLPPEENSNRLHCANGVTAGHDGWLYLSLGDRGCDVKRPEGDRLLFQQGGILRCRFDGSDLHVFSTGLRNIYDVALDAELNVFVRDNENDGGDYMIRVCQCFFGSDHGYPYHYYERPEEPMKPLADLGRGSSAGGTGYLETAFPPEFRESLFFCEWGRAVVRYRQTRRSGSFEPMTEVDFAAGAAGDPYGFKPTDLVVDRDGSLLISDWCDGQRPKRGRGRIYRVEHVGDASESRSTPVASENDLPSLIKQLNSESYHERVAAQLGIQRAGDRGSAAVLDAIKTKMLRPPARLHVVWIIAQSNRTTALNDLFALAEFESDPRVQAQAVRAIGDLTDPILTRERVIAGRGDTKVAERIAAIGEDADPRVLLEVLIVLRRLHWSKTPAWIVEHLQHEDPALNHAAQQALRNARNWIGVVKLLDETPRFRRLALQAMAEQRVEFLADQMMRRLADADDPQHRREYADALSRIVRKRELWTYWGFRPEPRKAATVDWEKTEAIVAALNGTMTDPNFDVRAFALGRMQREGAAPGLEQLGNWLNLDTDATRVAGILSALRERDADEVRSILTQTIQRPDLPNQSRLTAFADFVNGLPTNSGMQLVRLALTVEDGPILSALLKEFGQRPEVDVDNLLLEKLESPAGDVRAEAIRALATRRNDDARSRVAALLEDDAPAVRLAAAEAAGTLNATDAADVLTAIAKGDRYALVAASLKSLRELRDGRAVDSAVRALENRESQMSALRYLSEFGRAVQIESVVKAAVANPSIDLQRQAERTLAAWDQRLPNDRAAIRDAMATLHGRSGQPLHWRVAGPVSDERAEQLLERLIGVDSSETFSRQSDVEVRSTIAEGVGAEVRLAGDTGPKRERVWLAWTSVRMSEPADVEVLASATGRFTVRLNERQIHSRTTPGSYRPDSDRFSVGLTEETSRLIVEIRSTDASPRFHLRFRRRSSKAEHERLIKYALSSRGNANRGREVFANAEKSSCIRCHRLGDQGGRIGPDLTGIGRRFSRIHLIESMLEPSRTVAPSYATITVILNSGRVVSGIQVSKTDEVLILGDNQAKLHEIPTSEIDRIVSQKQSTMPEGLEKKLSDREFIDLLMFLESQKGQ